MLTLFTNCAAQVAKPKEICRANGRTDNGSEVGLRGAETSRIGYKKAARRDQTGQPGTFEETGRRPVAPSQTSEEEILNFEYI